MGFDWPTALAKDLIALLQISERPAKSVEWGDKGFCSNQNTFKWHFGWQKRASFHLRWLGWTRQHVMFQSIQLSVMK
jgi:hypothetical protein